MKTKMLIAVVVTFAGGQFAFAQMGGYGSGMNNTSQPPSNSTGGAQKTTTSTTTKKVMPVGVKGYLDDQLAHSKDGKFHVTLNGKDVALTPVKIHEGSKSLTPVDMKAADGKTYEIDFVTSNGQVTGARVGKVNGKAP